MNTGTIEILEYVKRYTDKAHGNQVRKYTGERYIVHPLRVMEMVREFNDDICVLAAALLHDVLEDTPVTSEKMDEALRQTLDPAQAKRVVELVTELTDIFIMEHYPRLNRRSRKEKEAERLSAVSADAQSIKYADIIDNVTDIVRQDAGFARVFVQEAKRMLLLMDAGNQQLRARAVTVVEQCLQNLKKAAEPTELNPFSGI